MIARADTVGMFQLDRAGSAFKATSGKQLRGHHRRHLALSARSARAEMITASCRRRHGSRKSGPAPGNGARATYRHHLPGASAPRRAGVAGFDLAEADSSRAMTRGDRVRRWSASRHTSLSELQRGVSSEVARRSSASSKDRRIRFHRRTQCALQLSLTRARGCAPITRRVRHRDPQQRAMGSTLRASS